jgi:hypothetical protein
MPEIIDTMTTRLSETPYFVGDNSVYYKTPIFTSPKSLYNTDLKRTFIQGDNFIIQTAGIVFPENYTIWKDPFLGGSTGVIPSIGIYIRGAVSATVYPIDVLGAFKAIRIPMENFEYALNVFVDTVKMGVNENFYFETTGIFDSAISTKTAPSSFNSQNFAVVPFIKILHNSVLVSGSR